MLSPDKPRIRPNPTRGDCTWSGSSLYPSMLRWVCDYRFILQNLLS